MRSSVLAAAVAALALASAAAAPASLRATSLKLADPAVVADCSTPAYDVHFKSLTIMPLTPVPGQPATMNATGGVSSAAISAGNIVLTVFLDGIQLYQNNANACGLTTINLPLGFGSVNVIGLPCPVAAGAAVTTGAALTLPTGVPSGQYAVVMDSTDQNNNHLFCYNVSFSF